MSKQSHHINDELTVMIPQERIGYTLSFPKNLYIKEKIETLPRIFNTQNFSMYEKLVLNNSAPFLKIYTDYVEQKDDINTWNKDIANIAQYMTHIFDKIIEDMKSEIALPYFNLMHNINKIDELLAYALVMFGTDEKVSKKYNRLGLKYDPYHVIHPSILYKFAFSKDLDIKNITTFYSVKSSKIKQKFYFFIDRILTIFSEFFYKINLSDEFRIVSLFMKLDSTIDEYRKLIEEMIDRSLALDNNGVQEKEYLTTLKKELKYVFSLDTIVLLLYAFGDFVPSIYRHKVLTGKSPNFVIKDEEYDLRWINLEMQKYFMRIINERSLQQGINAAEPNTSTIDVLLYNLYNERNTIIPSSETRLLIRLFNAPVKALIALTSSATTKILLNYLNPDNPYTIPLLNILILSTAGSKHHKRALVFRQVFMEKIEKDLA